MNTALLNFNGMPVQISRDYKVYRHEWKPAKNKWGRKRKQKIKVFCGWNNLVPEGEVYRAGNRLIMRESTWLAIQKQM